MTVQRRSIATQNCEYGHNPREQAQRIYADFEHSKTDVKLLTEVLDYLHELDAICKRTGDTLIYNRRARHGNEKNSAILVRRGHHIGNTYAFQVGLPYHATNGDLRRAVWAQAAVVDGVPYVAVHMAVGAWKVGHFAGHRLIGPPLRKASYVYGINKLKRIAHRSRHPMVIGGDWNASPGDRGWGSPESLRKALRGTYLRPHKTTGHGEIDFFILVGGTPAWCHAERRSWTDHYHVTGTFTYRS